MVEISRENGIQVIYLPAPFNEASFRNTKTAYMAKYDSLFMELATQYSEVLFLSKIRYYENSFFSEASHLNETGQVRFSAEIKQILETTKLYNN